MMQKPPPPAYSLRLCNFHIPICNPLFSSIPGKELQAPRHKGRIQGLKAPLGNSSMNPNGRAVLRAEVQAGFPSLPPLSAMGHVTGPPH